MPIAFEYTNSAESVRDQSDFVLRVPAGIGTKEKLLAELANAGQFPGYFGENWDALLDCLRDFS